MPPTRTSSWTVSLPSWLHPALGEREVAAALLAHAARTAAPRPGLILISDKGLAGREFEDLVTTGYGLRLVRPDRRDEPPRHWSIGWIR